MSELDAVFTATVRDVFAGFGEDVAATQVFARLDEIGLARLLAPETSGGSGAGWTELAYVLKAAARAAIPTGIVGSDVLAGWLRRKAGLADDGGLRGATLVDATGRERAGERPDGVESIVALVHSAQGWMVDGTAVSGDVAELFLLRGALARANQVAGTLEEIGGITTEHVTTRTQFGRTLAKFQVLQQMLADSAAQTALTIAAVDAAVATADAFERAEVNVERLRFDVAVARSCAGHAASTVVRNAHQSLGAIGTTAEHRLHRYTLPALRWSAEFGSTQYWDDVVADEAQRVGGDGLWELIVG